MKNINNKAVIAGTVVSEPACYDCCGESFYSFNMAGKRDSGVEDVLPVNISQLLTEKITIGEKLHLEGQIRTYNKSINSKNKLVIVFFAQEIKDYQIETNQIELTGYFCKKPAHRTTPLGRDICDVLLAVNRERGKSDYIPCIIWGRTAAHIGTLDTGVKVSVKGRFQSREYEKKSSDNTGTYKMTAYEVSVNRIAETEEEE